MTGWDVQDLFRRHGRELKRFLQRRGVSTDTAADLTQDTFLRLLVGTPSAPIGNARAYLFRTANNLSIDLARRQRLLPLIDDAEAVFGSLADESPSAERVVMSRQELAILQRALDEVPDGPRDVFLARLDGLTFDEIGRRLGIPTRTAFSRMVKVLAHLKSALDSARG